MSWESFERLLLRLAREVVGLRNLMEFGTRGQAQEGLDVVGLDAAGDAEGVQGKRYQKFSRADLDKAVDTFLRGSIAVPVQQLYVGVSCVASDTAVGDGVLELNQLHRPVQFELWDRKRISEMLRPRPDIVREFFGAEAARRFCPLHQTSSIEVPGPSALATANAVLQGPLTSSGAQHYVDDARAAEESDPEQALGCLRTAQHLLVEAGFGADAETLDTAVATLLSRLDRADEATRLSLDRFWVALRDDLATTADTIARGLADDWHLSSGTATANPSPFGHAAGQLARTAADVYRNPFDALPVLEQQAPDPALRIDHARLVLLCAEVALASGQDPWLQDHLTAVEAAADAASGHDANLQVRLRLVVADINRAWADLIRDARRRQLTRDLAGLVLARHARHLALDGKHREADDAWLEAVEQGCLAERNTDAADWLHSRRRLAARYTGVVNDPIFPLITSLRRRPTRPPVAAAPKAHEYALAALQRGRQPEAARRLRRYLRDAVVSGAWQDEHDARTLLADLYRNVGEPAQAAHHLVLAGEATAAEQLGLDAGDTYLEVTTHLASKMYWVHATALRLIAAQADVLPDATVGLVTADAFDVLDQATAGTLVDTPLFSPSLYLAAHKALAALASRLPVDQAQRLLDHLAPLVATAEGTYRYTDDEHAASCAAVGAAFPTLLDAALDQLVGLLARADHALKRPARDLLIEHLPRVRDRIRDLAGHGNRTAQEIVALAEPGTITKAEAEAAYQALTAPLTNSQGFYGIGTSAIGESHAAAVLPPDRRAALVRHQLDRVRSPYEATSNRIDYLHAAANLADNLPPEQTVPLFDDALGEATHAALSEPDALNSRLNHPLGTFRMTGADPDSRPAAAFLAARLAETADQRQQARDAALQLIGADGEADYDVTRSLQILQDGLERDVPILAKLGWALRSLAAQVWARTPTLPAALGDALAADPDPRVRRALAHQLSTTTPDDRTHPARQQLLTDPRQSVRRLIPHQP